MSKRINEQGRSLHMFAALLGAAALALAPGCDESGPRVYTAERYSPDDGCRETYAPIGLVEAEAVSSQCPPLCLGLGGDVYVSSVCPPYPAEASIEPDDSEACAAALAAPSCDDLGETPDAAAP
ncbi:MAG TPA: hypothetical protein VMG12_12395 [Polyangiaceae bacterium]|nr:hypothetical protein [Polyangiaceae bacterium]